MIAQLPEAYIVKMKQQLNDEAERFFSSYEQARTHGLRLNPLKVRPGSLGAERLIEQFELSPVPWCPTGYYYPSSHRPGKHPYHAAGLYYIQEPSAMSAVEWLDPQPGETILDLAAAPGGKSTQIAGKMQGKGLLVANEIHPARAKILAENMERMGVSNAIVTQASPDKLMKRLDSCFDRIMLDAPCSGEGMFRKDPQAMDEWSPELVAMCAARQLDILRQAVPMLKPGGIMAYSTCTFSEEENEQVIGQITDECTHLEVLRTERLWPHRNEGEGHFVALLRKREEGGSEPASKLVTTGRVKSTSKNSLQSKAVTEAWKLYSEFTQRYLSKPLELPPGEPILFGDQLYWLPFDREARWTGTALEGLKTVRPGLHLGTIKKRRLDPAHALALALKEDMPRSILTVSSDSGEANSYLHGETLPVDNSTEGWVLVTVDGYPVGWGKASGGQLKNHYPKGLRWPR
ncbi:RsmB/NOP family class I SAM-dependent RNA methyltransferase [Paenibacillus sp. J2TS4]|uniref:RsmB/NOP family class I SAM-dependent RNA methyltransferase n=1 Tax=Paenibacillus sp. J2TS4 TaxID=2807194 RepID=UPI001B2DB15D|nr:RsmB/NOP family class I SAM-dependent RNA methyltransferase [Paenibacillus sp. J2TS4]GIP33931.1 methylase [Paenibacillus sp. J2TS4]